MISMVDKSCKEFIEVLASKAPVPGGGGAAALGGAIGMALCNMVGNLTVGKKKYADVEPEVKDLLERGYKIIAELEALVDKDAEVFEPLSKAYSLPKNTPEEIKYKEEVMEKCSKEACSVPMEIMRKAYEGIKIHRRMGEIGSMLAISDVGCGVVFMKAALISAKLNVIINLNTIKDQNFVESAKEEMDRLVNEGCKMADETLDLVISKLSK
ncbi:MAG: cyclodeaminase/cyclohydrolase family protein [Thermodesulfovibrionales bacterium]|nr:cyclodeaminase/cyclohydrolase family protein [Thermodesulfovibrionales bacterium]